MHFRLALPALMLLSGAGATAPLSAQDGTNGQGGGPQIEVSVLRGTSTDGAAVRATGLLRHGKTRELLHSGFPTAMHFRLELWREGRIFDELESSTAWEVLVRYDPYAQQYSVFRRGGRSREDLSGLESFEAVEAEIARAYPVALRPARRGRYYYNLVVDVETLSVTDLTELERWLRGDLQPAVRGRRDPFTALRRGIGTLLSRVLGGDKRHYEVRTGTFAP